MAGLLEEEGGLHPAEPTFVDDLLEVPLCGAHEPTQPRRFVTAGKGNKVPEDAAVLLSGVPVEDRQVLQIAGVVEPKLGSKLVTAYRLHSPVVALNPREREAILAALETAPALRDLRDALVANDAWQTRKSLRR